MTDLETRLAEARERLVIPGNASQGMQHNGFDVSTRRLLQGLASDASFLGFDNCAAIAREVVAEKDRVISQLYSFAEIQRYQAALAEKDAEIARLEAEIVKWRTWATEMPDYGWDLDDRDSPLWRWFDDMPKDTASAAAEPRKVSDAQRERFYERIERDVHRSLATIIGNDLLAIIESPADAEATK